jgi:hypothetical protein
MSLKMIRETRANLIFLAIFLAISLPGAVMLVKKKSEPGAPAMSMPDYVRQRLPYMAPQRTPDSVIRVVPELTGRWVDAVNREQGGGPAVLMNGHVPLISDDRAVQVVSISKERVFLLIWDEGATVEKVWADMDGTRIDGQVQAMRKPVLPEAVRKELMYGGVIRPPREVEWVAVAFATDVEGCRPLSVYVSHSPGAVSCVNVFTNSATDGN